MTLKARIMSIIALLGILGSCSAADMPNDLQDIIKSSNQIQLKDLLSINDENNLAGSSAALMTLTGSSGTIHFLKAYLYHSNTTLCNGTLTLLGAVSVVDNGSGFPFTAGQDVSFNQNAAYTLYTNTGQGLPNPSVVDTVTCMKIYLTGGNDTNYHSSCMQFGQTCSGSTCIASAPTTVSSPWVNTAQTPCQTPLLYAAASSSGPQVWYCTIPGDGTLGCTHLTSFAGTGAFGVAINNGYAYFTDPNFTQKIYPCTIAASNGVPTCAAGTTFTGSPKGLALNSGVYYYTGGNQFLYAGGITQNTGAFSAPTSGGTQYHSPLGININNGYAYFVNQFPNPPTGATNDAVYYCTLAGVCNPTTTGLVSGVAITSAYDIALNNGYAYIPYATSSPATTGIMYCKVNDGLAIPADKGKLQNCQPTGSGVGLDTPQSIVIYNGIAYIGNRNGDGLGSFGNGFIGSCPVNALTGALGTCKLAFSSPSGFILAGINLMAVY